MSIAALRRGMRWRQTISSGWSEGLVRGTEARVYADTNEVDIMGAPLVVIADAEEKRTRSCMVNAEARIRPTVANGTSLARWVGRIGCVGLPLSDQRARFYRVAGP